MLSPEADGRTMKSAPPGTWSPAPTWRSRQEPGAARAPSRSKPWLAICPRSEQFLCAEPQVCLGRGGGPQASFRECCLGARTGKRIGSRHREGRSHPCHSSAPGNSRQTSDGISVRCPRGVRAGAARTRETRARCYLAGRRTMPRMLACPRIRLPSDWHATRLERHSKTTC